MNNTAVGNTDWSKLETDHLFRLCEKYSLRFIIIADRFEDDIDDREEQEIRAQFIGSNKKRELKNKEKQDKKQNKSSI